MVKREKNRDHLTPERKEFFEQLTARYEQNLTPLLQLSTGGMGMTLEGLLFEYHRINREVDEVVANPSAFDILNEKGVPIVTGHDRLRDLRKMQVMFSGEIRKLNDQALRGIKTKLEVERERRKQQEEDSKPKPGFSPLGKAVPVDADWTEGANAAK